MDRLKNWLANQFTLDTPQQDLLSPETAGDTALSLVPGVGQAMAVRDMARGIKAGDAGQTAMAAVGLLPFGKLGSVLKNKIIAGQTAKHFPMEKASVASQMTREGRDPSSVWQSTGIEHTAEGLPSFEIPDVNAKLLRTGEGKLSEILDHPELFDNYDKLRGLKTKVTIDPNLAKGRGEGVYHKGTIDVTAPDAAEARKILLHETQHGVQKLEDWHGGGAPEDIEAGIARQRRLQGDSSYTSDPALAHELYRRLLGENQANTVMTRADLEPALSTMVRPEITAPYAYARGSSGEKPAALTAKDVERQIAALRGRVTPGDIFVP